MELALPTQTVRALHVCLDCFEALKIPYHLCGGVAAHFYGARRVVNDLDFEVHDADLPKVVDYLQTYLKVPTERYRDAKWDLLLAQFDIEGQWVDVNGADSGRMTNLAKTAWLSAKSEFTRDVVVSVAGRALRLMHPADLAAYKRELDFDYQHIDIAACKAYLAKHSGSSSRA